MADYLKMKLSNRFKFIFYLVRLLRRFFFVFLPSKLNFIKKVWELFKKVFTNHLQIRNLKFKSCTKFKKKNKISELKKNKLTEWPHFSSYHWLFPVVSVHSVFHRYRQIQPRSVLIQIQHHSANLGHLHHSRLHRTIQQFSVLMT